MKTNETTSNYLIRSPEYSNALANIGEPGKEKELIMRVIYGLRKEYNGLKFTLLHRQASTYFQELKGLLADHEFMVKKSMPTVTPIQAFSTIANTRSTTASSPVPLDTLQTLQQLMSQLGLQLQPTPSISPQSFYTNMSSSSLGRGSNNRRGRGNYS